MSQYSGFVSGSGGAAAAADQSLAMTWWLGDASTSTVESRMAVGGSVPTKQEKVDKADRAIDSFENAMKGQGGKGENVVETTPKKKNAVGLRVKTARPGKQ